jgi:hypothetical protein
MPEYIYQNPETDEYVIIIQTMNEKHELVDENGLEWKRVLTCPKLNIDSDVDPFNKNQYLDKTKNMKGSMGDLMDQSREMSEKRAAICGGTDPVKSKAMDNWSNKRGGMAHPQDERKRTAENKHVKIDY